MPMTWPAAFDQSSTGVARADGGVGLDEVGVGLSVGGAGGLICQVALHTAHDAEGDRVRVPGRAADGDGVLTHFHLIDAGHECGWGRDRTSRS